MSPISQQESALVVLNQDFNCAFNCFQLSTHKICRCLTLLLPDFLLSASHSMLLNQDVAQSVQLLKCCLKGSPL